MTPREQLALLAPKQGRQRKSAPLTRRAKTQLVAPPSEVRTLRFFIPGEPVPCQSMRVGRYGQYQPARQAAWKRHVASVARVAAYNARWTRCDWPVKVTLLIHRAREAGDADNHAKGVNDGITKAGNVWVDDRVIHDLHIRFTQDGDVGVHVTITWEAGNG